MLNVKKRLFTVLPLTVVACLLCQGACTTTPWHTWHYPYLGESGTAEATLYELDITVIPPNPPLTTEYEVITDWISLGSKDMELDYYSPYPGTDVYVGHEVEFSPDLADASAMTIARYTHAYKIQMVSEGLNGNGVYETDDMSRPGDWTTCGPAFP